VELGVVSSLFEGIPDELLPLIDAPVFSAALDNFALNFYTSDAFLNGLDGRFATDSQPQTFIPPKSPSVRTLKQFLFPSSPGAGGRVGAAEDIGLLASPSRSGARVAMSPRAKALEVSFLHAQAEATACSTPSSRKIQSRRSCFANEEAAVAAAIAAAASVKAEEVEAPLEAPLGDTLATLAALASASGTAGEPGKSGVDALQTQNGSRGVVSGAAGGSTSATAGGSSGPLGKNSRASIVKPPAGLSVSAAQAEFKGVEPDATTAAGLATGVEPPKQKPFSSLAIPFSEERAAALSDTLKALSRKSRRDPLELQVIQRIIDAYPEGINLHTVGRYPCPQLGRELAKKYQRTAPDPLEEVRIVSDVIFESVLGIPGFLVWIAFPVILSHYKNNPSPVPHSGGFGGKLYTYSPPDSSGEAGAIPPPCRLASELIEYGPTVSLIYAPETGSSPEYTISGEILLRWYNEFMAGLDQHERLFNVLRLPENPFVCADDLKRVAWVLLRLHPGLAFLSDTPQFQSKYAETVAARIVFELDPAGKGVLTALDLKRTHHGKEGGALVWKGYGSLLESLWHSQFEADINKILKFFSYEHFYVIYCKFWELDEDHDQRISLAEFQNYDGGNTLSPLIARRAFELLVGRRIVAEAASGVSDGTSGLASGDVPSRKSPGACDPLEYDPANPYTYLTYSDFVSFILAEENKDLDSSVLFWFEATDLDGDGYISYQDFEPLYEQHRHTLELDTGVDAPASQDVFCQLVDQIKAANGPERLLEEDDRVGFPVAEMSSQNSATLASLPRSGGGRGPAADTATTYCTCRAALPRHDGSTVSLQEIMESKVRGNLFDLVSNYRKMALFESRDPYNLQWGPNTPEQTSWDLFCKRQYELLVNASAYDDDT